MSPFLSMGYKDALFAFDSSLSNVAYLIGSRVFGGGGGNYFSFTRNCCVHRQLMLKRVHLRESSPPRKRIRVREDRVREKISGSRLVVKGLGLDNHDYSKKS